MLTLGAYLHYVCRPRSMRRLLAVIFVFALGLMCKPTLVTLPFVLLLLDWWPLGRFAPTSAAAVASRRNDRGFRVLSVPVAEKIPLLALSGAASVATVLAQQGAVVTLGKLSLPERIGNALASYVIYLRQMFWPAGLGVFYPRLSGGPSLFSAALAFLLLAAISFAVIALRKRHPCLAVGWFWYLGMLLPMIGIVQVGSQAYADRYTYLPQIGLYLMIAWGGGALCPAWHCRRILLGAASVVIVVSFAICAWIQTSYWHNSESLWTHTLACTTGNAFAHYNIGVLDAEKGQTDEAIEHFNDCLKIKPDSAEAHCSLGNALVQSGMREEAMIHFRKALELKPDYPEASFKLGMALAQEGKVAEAMTQYRQVLAALPDSVEALDNLAWLLATSADPLLRDGPKAVQLAERAQSLTKGRDANVLDTLAAAYAEAGDFAKAVQTAQNALQLAQAQSNTQLAEALRREISLYQAGHRWESP